MSWDAVYFLDIAENGYMYEQEFAFFPGLPILLRIGSRLLLRGNSSRAARILIGALMTNVAFVLAVVALYKLGRHLLQNERTALAAALLFSITPAGFFMSAIYTESPFALFSFLGLLQHSTGHDLNAALMWALATCFRSNGIAFIGFFLWRFGVHPGLPGRGHHGYHIFCATRDESTRRTWCNSKIPLIYSYVQEAYWNNGFLRYFQPQQVPNFLLAAPMFTISGAGVLEYARKDLRRFFTLDYGVIRNGLTGFWSSRLLPYIYLWMCLLLYCGTMMHVQVATRFFTSMPCVYWYAGHLVSMGNGSLARKLVAFFVCYGMVTTVLFASFLPPA
ncbi:GPI mannosyltransferase 2 [Gaertneriomyces semiglobifer]|nr:GPI mannosyltransferase 2 [Gaertneriomyces semiglobifer]